MRLVEYFNRKEAGDAGSSQPHGVTISWYINAWLHTKALKANVLQYMKRQYVLNSNCCLYSVQETGKEYNVALEKTASLYDRVTALRNAATEKLESLRQSNSSTYTADYHTANTVDTRGRETLQSEYMTAKTSMPRGKSKPREDNLLSDYAKSRQQEAGGQSTTEQTSDFITGSVFLHC